MEVKRWLEQTFPELRGKVTGGNYMPGEAVQLMLKLMTVLQLLGVALVLMGETFFSMIGIQRLPHWYQDVFKKNPVPIMIGLYIVLPQILNGYVVSGAFEVFLDGSELIFSKMATGAMPTVDDLLVPLTKAGLTAIQIE